MIADYDHARVMLFPGVYPDSSVQADIVSICHPNAAVCNGIPILQRNQERGLGGGVIAGIVSGIVAIIGLIGLGITLAVRARRRKYKEHENCVHCLKPELDGGTSSTGLPLPRSPQQLPDSAVMLSESGGSSRFEMPGHVDTPELEVLQLYEMQA